MYWVLEFDLLSFLKVGESYICLFEGDSISDFV